MFDDSGSDSLFKETNGWKGRYDLHIEFDQLLMLFLEIFAISSIFNDFSMGQHAWIRRFKSMDLIFN